MDSRETCHKEGKLFLCHRYLYSNIREREKKNLEYRHKCAITSTNSWQYIVSYSGRQYIAWFYSGILQLSSNDLFEFIKSY